jgi:hypothetical protein
MWVLGSIEFEMKNRIQRLFFIIISVFLGTVVYGQGEVRKYKTERAKSSLNTTLSSFLEENRSNNFGSEQKECLVILSFNSDEDTLDVFYKSLQKDWAGKMLDLPVVLIVRPFVGYKTLFEDCILKSDTSKHQSYLQLGHLNMLVICQDKVLYSEVMARLGLSKKDKLYDFEYYSHFAESDTSDVAVLKKKIAGACLIDEKKSVLKYIGHLRDSESVINYKFKKQSDRIRDLMASNKRDSLVNLENQNEIERLEKIINDRKPGVESYSLQGDVALYSSELSFLGQDVKCQGFSNGISIGKRRRNEGSNNSFEFGVGFGNRTLRIEQNENYQESVAGSNYSDILRVKGFNEELSNKYINGFLQWKYQLNSFDAPVSYSASIGYQLGINYNYVVKSNSYQISNSRLYNQFPTEISSLAGQNLYNAYYSYNNQLSGTSRLYHCVLFGAEAIWYVPKNNDFALTAQGQFGFSPKSNQNDIGADYAVDASRSQSSVILSSSNWMPKQFAINVGLIYIMK